MEHNGRAESPEDDHQKELVPVRTSQAADGAGRSVGRCGAMIPPSGSSSPVSSNSTMPLQRRLHPCSGWHVTVRAASRSRAVAVGHGGWCWHILVPPVSTTGSVCGLSLRDETLSSVLWFTSRRHSTAGWSSSWPDRLPVLTGDRDHFTAYRSSLASITAKEQLLVQSTTVFEFP
jgi:hypothetical protein